MKPFFLVALILAILAFGAADAVQFKAFNNAKGTAGGNRFDSQIGISYTTQVMSTSSNFIWKTLNQKPADRRNHVYSVMLAVEPVDGVAYESNNVIHISASYIANYSGDLKTEFTGIIYHEMTHVWQSNGQGGLPEGIADYMRLKAGYARSDWVKPGQGNYWYQGYDVTARFLDYCNGLKNGFVAQLNAKIKDGYYEDVFVQLLGKTVDQLWSDYKAKYGN
ncbi:uncharacterized protein LOC144557465 [Carex rostrata]